MNERLVAARFPGDLGRRSQCEPFVEEQPFGRPQDRLFHRFGFVFRRFFRLFHVLIV